MKDLLTPIKALSKSGDEQLTFNGEQTNYRLLDFWQWSVSDLVSNATRGRLAEFIVGVSLGISPDNLRDEWAPYDLLVDGIRIEIKSAAYIQSWQQNNLSPISFSIKPARYWNSTTGSFEGEIKRHADIYVFCVLHHQTQETIDPLKLEQWEFFVLPTFQLDNYTRSQSSITLSSLRNLTAVTSYPGLKTRIFEAHSEQRKMLPPTK